MPGLAPNGTQYAEPSMSRRGNCPDNAVAESFFQLLKRERIRGQTYPIRDDARRDVFDYIEMFYNPKRKHTNNGMLLPVDFENRQQKNESGRCQGNQGHLIRMTLFAFHFPPWFPGQPEPAGKLLSGFSNHHVVGQPLPVSISAWKPLTLGIEVFGNPTRKTAIVYSDSGPLSARVHNRREQ